MLCYSSINWYRLKGGDALACTAGKVTAVLASYWPGHASYTQCISHYGFIGLGKGDAYYSEYYDTFVS